MASPPAPIPTYDYQKLDYEEEKYSNWSDDTEDIAQPKEFTPLDELPPPPTRLQTPVPAEMEYDARFRTPESPGTATLAQEIFPINNNSIISN